MTLYGYNPCTLENSSLLVALFRSHRPVHVSQTPSAVLVAVHADIPDHATLAAGLQQLATCSIQVSALSTGMSKEVHGQVCDLRTDMV